MGLAADNDIAVALDANSGRSVQNDSSQEYESQTLHGRITAQDWPQSRRWITTLILSSFAFLQPLTETMLAPVEKQISHDLNIERSHDWLLVNSLVLIGVGLAPLVLAPLSEVYGRKPILVYGSIYFAVWNTACGGSQTLVQLLVLRLLSGFGASVADSIAGGVMSDLWRPEERGKAFAVFMAAPLLGPALGPICGAFISEGTTWRWVFFVTSIACVVVIVVAVAFLRETYEPRLRQLQQRRATRSSSPASHAVRIQDAGFGHLMRENLQRPLRMLGTQVIVQLLATYMALLYGTMFLFLFMYPRMWQEQYGQSIRIGSFNYISFAIGLILGVNISGFLNDHIYVKLKARNNNIGEPEFRVPTMVIGTILVPIGLLWWGWAGQARLHWIMPNIGSLLFAMGVYICSSCVSVYTIDTYNQYAASAISTNLVARSITAAFFPLFAPYLFDALRFGLGATVLAGIFTLFGAVAVTILWFRGKALRAKIPCSAVHPENQGS
ncbi:hypothetical protein HIM_04192 [Hirsutella minnesotensis 3608]|uniref:Major facilitator superfamily (MFS) profile domain-containing protein n=1 Tax=Hirsutella minnesotensis 3608 TaxID=1043627 RepID=A0A0F7ZVE3_9HYPO|nr:hypothetical protein HIM_04192 [Hirsutella minnesotensis 3608]